MGRVDLGEQVRDEGDEAGGRGGMVWEGEMGAAPPGWECVLPWSVFWGVRFRVWGLGLRVSGFGFWVWGLGFEGLVLKCQLFWGGYIVRRAGESSH